jgi:integrase
MEVARMERRQRGLGGVYRRSDGRWEGRIRIRGGRRRSFYARTRRDAVRRLGEARWALGPPWHPIWVLLGTSGLRLGEALGLHWQDINFAGRQLAVRCALQRQRGRGLVLVPPKTTRSRRTIYLSELALSALTEQRQRQEDRRKTATRWADSGLVFTNRTGGGLEQGVVERALVQALAGARLPRVRVHDLRHSTASILLAAGTHPKVVQDLLGHSTITLTLDTYSHLTQPLHEQAAQTMDALLTMN